MLPVESVWLLRTALGYMVVGFGLGALALAFSAGTGRAMLIASHAEMVLIGFAAQFTLGVAWSSFPRTRGSRGNPLLMRAAYALLNGGVVVMVAANVVAALPAKGSPVAVAGDVASAAAAIAATGGTLVLGSAAVASAALWRRVRPV